MTYWIDISMQFIAGDDKTQVSLKNRGLNYGDGIFTTIGVRGTTITLVPYHQQRLQKGLDTLRIALPDWDELWAFAQTLVNTRKQAALKERAVLKILITRGEGGRGYSAQGCSEPLAYFSISAFPAHYDEWRDSGISVAISDIALGHHPLLAGIKHCNRLEQVLARKGLDIDRHHQDHLLCDIAGNLIEASAGNIFIKQDGCWKTPDLSLAGVDGVMRQWLMDTYCQDKHITVVDGLTTGDLYTAESAFICNSLMGLVPVRQFEKQCYDIAPVKTWATSIQQKYSNIIL